MREIRFRGKRIDTEEWVYGNYFHYNNKNYNQGLGCFYIQTKLDKETLIEDFEVIPKTVGQFTGLYDRNGKEIYEGDMLRLPAKDQHEQNNFVAYEVFWHDNDCADRHIGWQMNRQHFQGSLCGNDMGCITFLPRWTKKMEVIGNIHDNLELMKGGKE